MNDKSVTDIMVICFIIMAVSCVYSALMTPLQMRGGVFVAWEEMNSRISRVEKEYNSRLNSSEELNRVMFDSLRVMLSERGCSGNRGYPSKKQCVE